MDMEIEEQQQPAHRDCDGWKHDVEAHVGGELDARQDDRVHQDSFAGICRSGFSRDCLQRGAFNRG